jgi:hypothetical protein
LLLTQGAPGLGPVGGPGAGGLPGLGKYPWPVFSPEGPSLRELAVQALSSVEGGYDLLAPKFDHTPFRTPDGVLDATAGALRRLGPVRPGAGRVLRYRCGLRVLRSLCQGPVTGVDVSAGLLAQARCGDPGAGWVRALPLAGGFGLAVTSRWYWGLAGFDVAMRVRNALWRPPFVMYYRTCPRSAVRGGLAAAGFTVTTVPLTALGVCEDGSPKARLVLARTASTP